MLIRKASIEELKALWKVNSPTKSYFVEGMEKKNIEFWAVENPEDNDIIGELYIFWNSEDEDEANGIDKAYLCAFRIDPKFQGVGLGRALMERVLQRIAEKGFSEVTIGADNNDGDRLTKMYKSFGFTELIKLKNIDHHCLDANNEPIYEEVPWPLYLNRLREIYTEEDVEKL